MVADKGDIIRLSLEPTLGKETQGDYCPCLVLSSKAFNKVNSGKTLIAPITQGGEFGRIRGFIVPLMGSGTETQGVVLASEIKILDINARKAKMIEKAPQSIVDEVLGIVATIIDCDPR